MGNYRALTRQKAQSGGRVSGGLEAHSSEQFRGLGFIATALLAGLVLPVLTSIVAIFALAASSKKPIIIAGTTVFVVAVLLAFVNVGKSIESDWSWYVQHYKILLNTPLDEYMVGKLPTIIPEVTEPLYYAFSSVLSVASGGNIAVLAASVTLIIYGSLGAAIAIAVCSIDTRTWTVIVATVAGMLLGLTFTLSTQLVRQEIAASLIGLAIVASARRKWILSIIILLAASLTHNSALIPAAGIVLASFLRTDGSGWWFRFAASGIIFFGLGHLYLATTSAPSGNDNGSISTPVIILDLVILVAFIFLVRRRGLRKNPIASTILMCIPAFYGFVLGIASEPLPLLRMYFYVEILRALMVAFLCASVLRGRWRVVIGVVIIVSALAYLALRIQQSPFDYDNTLLDIVLWVPLGDQSYG